MSVETYSRDSKTDRESLLSRKTYTDVSSNARSQHNRRRLSALGRSIAAQSTADHEAEAATADREAVAASRTNQSPQMSEVMVLFESLSEVGAMGLVNAVEGLASRVTKCLRLFHLWDTNNDGILDINEVSAGLKLACEKLERSLVPIELVQESYLQGALASRTSRGLDVGGSVEEQLECCRACEEGWWYVRRAGSLYVYGTTYPPHELTPPPLLGTLLSPPPPPLFFFLTTALPLAMRARSSSIWNSPSRQGCPLMAYSMREALAFCPPPSRRLSLAARGQHTSLRT